MGGKSRKSGGISLDGVKAIQAYMENPMKHKKSSKGGKTGGKSGKKSTKDEIIEREGFRFSTGQSKE